MQEAASDTRPAEKGPHRKQVKLPGLIVDFEHRCVDLEAKVCLERGYLELVACTVGSKEHESIVSVVARPIHVHTALLLLGANNGNPAMRKQVNDDQPRWVELPPQGDPVEVSLVFKNSKGKMVERPIRDFVKRSGEVAGTGRPAGGNQQAAAFPKSFLFAGSQLRDAGSGPRQYLADRSGHVVSISSFGDELLCFPTQQTHANSALDWEVDSKHLPKVGTGLTLRLRPLKKSKSGVDN